LERKILLIAIGTKNPTKVNAVKSAFAPYISGELIATKVSSNVSAKPLTDEETMTGAINRAKNALEAENAQIGVGLEGGVVKNDMGIFLCNWGAIIDKQLQPIVAGGARILIPEEIGNEVFAGKELGDIMEQFAKKNVSQNEGAIGIFTNGTVDRTEMFTQLSKLLVGQFLYEQGNGLAAYRLHKQGK
jgi:inosine/xanthosine triphosphatase